MNKINRPIRVFASGDDWNAYVNHPHYGVLCSYAQDVSSSQPIAVLPDLAPSDGLPNGIVFTTNSLVYPYAVGRDFGCGYSYGLINDVSISPSTINEIRSALEIGMDAENDSVMRDIFLGSRLFFPDFSTDIASKFEKDFVTPRIRNYLYNAALKQAGIISPGNHFIEIHKLHSCNGDTNRQLPKGGYLLIIHNGSGIIGDIITGILDVFFGYKDIKTRNVLQSLLIDSRECEIFFGVKSIATNFARYHRFLISENIRKTLKVDLDLIGDNTHTDIIFRDKEVIHYSGVSQVEKPEKILFVGGSVGTKSKLVLSGPEVTKVRGISHGAGKKFYSYSVSNPVLNSSAYTNFSNGEYVEMSNLHRSAEESVRMMEQAGLAISVSDLEPILVYKNMKNAT